MKKPCGCGQPVHAHGLCLSCYNTARYRPHPVTSQTDRDRRVTTAHRMYPSTRLDDHGWHQLLTADDGLYQHILDDIARITRQQIDRGRLHLDRDGRETLGDPDGEVP